ncbi:MAG: hypothetical protein ABL308_01115 [Oceanicaulis sp.]
MNAARRIEVSLAGLIAGGALFAAMVPGASPDEGPEIFAPPALPSVDISQFQDIRVSDASRAVAASVISRDIGAARFAAPPPASVSGQEAALSVRPTGSVGEGAAWTGQAFGFEVTAAPQATGYGGPDWWLVGGAGRESYALAPGGLREYTIAPVSAEGVVGDAHIGVAMKVTDNAFAGIGYVREERRFTLGTEDWEESEHYLGVSFQARW